jgi:hypothetical protein
MMFYMQQQVYDMKVMSKLPRVCTRHEGGFTDWKKSNALLSSILDVTEWAASCFGRFMPDKKAPGRRWKGGGLDQWVGLDVVTKRKRLLLPRIEPVTSKFTDRIIPAQRNSSIRCFKNALFVLILVLQKTENTNNIFTYSIFPQVR